MQKVIYFLLLGVPLLFSCSKKEDIRVEEQLLDPDGKLDFDRRIHANVWDFDYNRQLPGFLGNLGLVPEFVDNKKAALGRILFYDKNLSRDHRISCASCHKQSFYFADWQDFSDGIEGQKAQRNTPSLMNVPSFSAHYRQVPGKESPLLLWDNRTSSVQEQSVMAFLNDHEMGMSMGQVVERVKEQPFYTQCWEKTYGHRDIREADILECLEAFVGAMGSHDSKLDVGLAQVFGNFNLPVGFDTMLPPAPVIIYYRNSGQLPPVPVYVPGIPTLSEMEDNGRIVFINNCTKCHSPLIAAQEVFEACNGLEMQYADNGIGQLTGNQAKNGVFKSPSLRNIQHTAPFMHDGRFKTLEQVVEFYDNGVQAHPNLHPLLRDAQGLPKKLGLTDLEKKQLVAFLKTLTDPGPKEDLKFSNPFRQ